MAKESRLFKCTNCEKETRQWAAKCFSCGSFSTLVEIASKQAQESTARSGLKSSTAVKPVKKSMSIDELNKDPIKRTLTGIGELDRVLGGGFVDAEVVLFAGQPGAGKSTLSLEVANRYAQMGKKILYSSGEESEQQIGLRARRMNVSSENIRIVNETNLEVLLGHIEEEQPDLLIVDSLQTLASSEIAGSIGSVSQSKEAAHALTRLAKTEGITMILVSQVVKSGEFAGAEAVQHIADCSMIFESDNDSPLKFLRAIKNRFGDTNEVGIFQHTETGLEEVNDPSGILLENEDDDVTGAACSFISEGIRQVPVEIQALVTQSNLTNPRKQFNGVQHQRGQIVCAILDKFCRLESYQNDIFGSTVSGVKVLDPQADLAMAAAILSSKKDKPIPSDVIFIGELSLTGQVRGGFMIESKLKEAERLGFRKVILPANALKKIPAKTKASMKLELVGIKAVKELGSLI